MRNDLYIYSNQTTNYSEYVNKKHIYVYNVHREQGKESNVTHVTKQVIQYGKVVLYNQIIHENNYAVMKLNN